MGIGRKTMSGAVFLDRDGVLNEVTLREGKPFPPSALADVRILPDVPEALRLLKNSGLALAVVTNQPDVARGTQSRNVVESINSWLSSQLPLDWFEVCYHDENDACDCRKPKPGLILRSARALRVEPTQGYMVGDRWRDIEAGKAAGCRTIWIDREYLEKQPSMFDFRCSSLLEAAQWILQQSKPWEKSRE
jgi:D-glycero-D-manno-heptose 1,7-bisphosphate phosphatase